MFEKVVDSFLGVQLLLFLFDPYDAHMRECYESLFQPTGRLDVSET